MSMGRLSTHWIAKGMRWGDKALANNVAKWGIIGGGAGLFLATRASDNSAIRGVGDVGLLSAAVMGGHRAMRAGGGYSKGRYMTKAAPESWAKAARTADARRAFNANPKGGGTGAWDRMNRPLS